MRALLFGALGLCGCAHFQSKDQTICPEYRSQVCLAGQQCSMDEERGCRVCQCDQGVPGSTDSGFTKASDPDWPNGH
jgi:hypothetical protein